jgi:RNA polymerase sigma-70 factor (family 1)
MAFRPHSNESALMFAAANGDERAFSKLFYWYYKQLGAYVFKITDSQILAEEIVQDAFVKIWLRRSTLENITSFGAYLLTICRHDTFKALKKIAAHKVLQAELEQYLMQEEEMALLDNPAEEFRTIIAKSVEKLPEQQRKVYIMSRYDRLKYEEIAQKLGLSPTTVKKHIQLATKFIQEDIATNKFDIGLIIILTTPLIL